MDGGGPVSDSEKDNGDDSTIVSPTGPWDIKQHWEVVQLDTMEQQETLVDPAVVGGWIWW